jgi:type IV secretion system protein VirB10
MSFFNKIPKVKSINQKRVTLVVLVIVFILLMLVAAGFMGLYNKDNSQSTLGLTQNNRSQINANNTDNLEKVALDWSTQSSGLNKPKNEESVPDINANNSQPQFTPSVNNGGEVPPIDEFQRQVIEVRQTNDLNKLKRHYAANNSRTLVYSRTPQDSTSSADSKSNNGPETPQAQDSSNKQANSKNTTEGIKTLEPEYKLGGNNTLIATTVIPAILIGTLVSDNSGPVSAQVSSDVYDSKTGFQLMIPKGSKMIGFYDGRVAYGSTRISVAFRQLCFPNGKCIDLAQEPGTDPQGAVGLHDLVDNHYWSLFGLNFIGSVIKNGASYAQNSAAEGSGLTPSAGGVGQDMGQTTNQVIDSKIQTSPTITIRGGSIIRIMLTNNMILKPYSED